MSGYESNVELAEREARATRLGLTLDKITDEMSNVMKGDRKVGEVMVGLNGEWFPVSLSRVSFADPLQGRDNIKGTGHRTALSAALSLAE